MSTEEKFFAAVDVVNSIPDDGTFEPSDEIMLKFYAYHKQATEGPCNESKPFFWNTMSRNKWHAWNELGDMPTETAMKNYIEELSKVIETMSYNERIARFISLMGSFYEMVSSEADCQKNQSSHSENWTEEIVTNSIFERYRSPTLSDLYHIPKRESTDCHKNIEVQENYKYSSTGDSSRNLHSVNYEYSKPPPRVYSHSSLSSSSSSSSDISNFDLISNSSGDESNIGSEREAFHLLNRNRNCTSHRLLVKDDLFVLTFINLQSCMEDVLEKIENLNNLALKRNQEKNCTNDENRAMTEWNLNFTETTFILLWPIIVGAVFG